MGELRAWSPCEDRQLRQAHEEGKTYAEIVRLVGRSINACWSRASLLKLPRRHQDTWHVDGLIESVTDAWKRGQSAAQIAAAHGLTKGQIIGKLNRLGLLNQRPKARRSVESKRLRKLEYQRKSRESQRRSPSQASKVAPPKRRAVPTLDGPPLSSLNIPFTETKRSHCRYMETDDRLCCGHPIWNETSWCSHHYRVCHANYAEKH